MTTSLSIEPHAAVESPQEIPVGKGSLNLSLIGKLLLKFLLIAIGLFIGSFFGLLAGLISGLVPFSC